MDDLWGNAWTNDSEQPKPTAPTTSSGASSSPLNTLPQWNFQPSDALHDSEVDVGISSWNPLGGSGIKWEDDAEPDTVPSFTWKPTRTDTWSSHESETEPQAEAEAEPEFEDAEEVSKAASERTSSPPPILPTPPRSPIPDLPPARTSPPPSTEGTPTTTFTAPLAPPSPDPFGSFETGTPYDPHITSHSEEDDDDEKWPAAPRHFDDVDDVEVVWSAGTVHTDHTEVEEDEWTKAQEEQMMRDRRVPPHVLAAIMDNWKSLAHDLGIPPITENPSTESWRKERISLLDQLSSLLEELAPADLPTPIRFSQTQTFTSFKTAHRLTRHTALARNSPLSHLSTKDSQYVEKWEKAVKERNEKANEDHWWNLGRDEEENVEEKASKDATKPGMLGFWGRKKTSTPIPTPPRPETPKSSTPVAQASPKLSVLSLPTSTVASSTSPVSSRQSIDSVRTPVSPAPPIAGPTPSVGSRPSTPQPPVGATSPETQSSAAAVPPSAVSRFLSRFSRTKSTGPSTPGHSRTTSSNSLSLSPDDLSFLGEIAPSSSTVSAPSLNSLDSLDNFLTSLSPSLGSDQLPPALSPPPPPATSVLQRIPKHTHMRIPSSVTDMESMSDGESLQGDLTFDELLSESMVPKLEGKQTWYNPVVPKNSILKPSSPELEFGAPLPPPLAPIRSQTPARSMSMTPPAAATFKAPAIDLFAEFEGTSSKRPMSGPIDSGSPLVPTLSPPPMRATPSPPVLSFSKSPPPARPTALSSILISPPPSLQSLGGANQGLAKLNGSLPPTPETGTGALDEDDGFGDFVSHLPPTPAPSIPSLAPPLRAVRSASPSLSPTLAPPPGPATPAMHRKTGSNGRRIGSVAELITNAAQRPGQWPAPPSPLPQAISGPPKSMFGEDLLSDSSPVESKPVSHTPTPGSGGLSAQDLLFFEG